MAVFRNTPYSVFNFQVKFGTTEAGFQEVTGFMVESHVMDYRNGNHGDTSTTKVMGLPKYSDVTFKRGYFGDLLLWNQLKNVIAGQGNTDQARNLTVTINLMDETGNTVVGTWLLHNARPIKLSGPTFNGKGAELGIEELVMSYEWSEQQ